MQAGTEMVTRRFPVLVGRQPGAGLQLGDPGVWDNHFQITLHRKAGFSLLPRAEAPTRINQDAVTGSTPLRNGDIITAGSAQIQFWLSPARQPSRQVLELLVWVGIAGVTLGQVWLIYWLLKIGG